MRWLACELHAHTLHSDGKMTLLELASTAAGLGFDCVALTDHNTMSGLADKAEVESRAGITILPGMEWTTFHGHMVTVGLSAYVDWREANPGNIHEGVSAVHARGGVAGLAHPFRIGSPACTGCYWEYEVQDWNDFDYIEVWSGTFAPIKTDNARAFALWTDKLNEGFRLAATSGRDWHAASETDEPISVTYLGLDDEARPVGNEAVEALRRGRVSVTLGPLLTLEAESVGAVYAIGDAVLAAECAVTAPIAIDDAVRAAERAVTSRIAIGNAVSASERAVNSPIAIGDAVPASERAVTARIAIDFSVRQGLWSLPDPCYRLSLTSNKGLLAERIIDPTDGTLEWQVALPTEGLIWMRAELRGNVRGVNAMIAFTNAIYFD